MYDGYADLAAAIVTQAVDDWRHICRTGTDLSSDTKKHSLRCDTPCTFGSLTAFLQSDWCELLCGDTARNAVMNTLNIERAKAIRRNKPRAKRASPNARMYQYGGEEHTLTEWAERTGIARRVLDYRLRKGLTFEQVLNYKSKTVISV